MNFDRPTFNVPLGDRGTVDRRGTYWSLLERNRTIEKLLFIDVALSLPVPFKGLIYSGGLRALIMMV